MSTTSRAPARKDTREIAMEIPTVVILDELFDTKKRKHNLLDFKSILHQSMLVSRIIKQQIVTHQTAVVGLFEETHQ